MMQVLRGANLALAFQLELVMLAALAYVGWQATSILLLQIALAIVLPTIAIVVWALWAAPRATGRLKQPGLTLLKVVLFGATAAALWAVGQGPLAALFALVCALNLSAAAAFGQE